MHPIVRPTISLLPVLGLDSALWERIWKEAGRLSPSTPLPLHLQLLLLPLLLRLLLLQIVIEIISYCSCNEYEYENRT